MKNKTQYHYRDTLNYAPVDVVKGIDLITKSLVKADDLAPPEYELLPKCKFCKHFSSGANSNYKGSCLGFAKPFLAYPDMIAKTCSSYIKNEHE
ncbi:MAG: 4-hydroxyphenylacetate decarboxylase small subunit [Oligoflexia bacterium]|nr:4-hydroxyphenylacetate decarboxylase small subunit [Oligoflexia bacterium]MBF0365485.1 4-hydroxyphenylacetate decarboxylase small subunit [Oligoflexia bacterium]